MAKSSFPVYQRSPTIIPPYLQSGDTIGITCPAGYFCLEDVQPAVQALELWGYRVKLGKTIDGQYYTYSGTDEERTADFQDMLDDPEIKAILFGRGGYGCIRIIDRINFNPFYLRPKWLCGYSDITVVHSYVQTQMHIPTLHCEMCIDLKYGTTDRSAETIRQAFRGDPLTYNVDPNPLNREGAAEGMLVGGNLSLLAAMIGSNGDLDTEGKILFIEDVHEYLYQIDSMLWTLKRAGKLAFLAGLVVGGFTRIQKDPGDLPFGQTAYEIVMDKVKEYDFPVCFGFPAGHEFDNFALRLGMIHHLSVGVNGCILDAP
ncbi:MAG TPA: LD-carboxypeptidase [Chitinophagaceae bacterium]|jgi:muramoyltetrapeptide carboxypeptidase|nr:LD-carboxypeptidase [Chitinophagaceae bacterium]